MIKYVNSKNEEIELLDYTSVLIKEGNLHEKIWEVETYEKRLGVAIRQFKKSPIEFSLILKFKGKRQKIVDNLNKFYDLTEYDILTKTPGKIFFNDWFLECFVLEDRTEPEEEDVGVEKEIKVYAPYPFWIKENTTIITPNDSEILDTGDMVLPTRYTPDFVEVGEANLIRFTNLDDYPNASVYTFFLDESQSQISATLPLEEEMVVMPGATTFGMYSTNHQGEETYHYELVKMKNLTALDYPHDYPYDLLSDQGIAYITNEGVVPSDAKLIFYGPAINPQVVIGENEYTVYTSIEDGERLVINTKDRTIEVIKADGSVQNAFSLRSPRSDFFRKIDVGKSEVMWDGSFGLDIVLVEERSTPKWI